jgi:hypothetical protein
MALIFCAVPQVWDENEEKDGERALPGPGDLTGNHEFSFKVALTQLLRNLMPFVMLPTWLLSTSQVVHIFEYQKCLNENREITI